MDARTRVLHHLYTVYRGLRTSNESRETKVRGASVKSPGTFVQRRHETRQ